MKSFLIPPYATFADVYEFLGAPIPTPEEIELPFLILCKAAVFRARPIER